MKILEQYSIKHFGEIFTIRLYNTGEHRCSCKHFHPFDFWGECPHIKSIKNRTAKIVEAKRFEQ